MQRRSQRSVEHSGGRAGRVSLWSGKGSSARVEAGTRLWRGSLEPLPIGIPRLQAGEDVKEQEFDDMPKEIQEKFAWEIASENIEWGFYKGKEND